MKKIALILLSCSLLFSNSTKSSENISLDLRLAYVNYNYDNYWSNSEAFMSSAKLGYKKELLSNLEAGIVFGAIEDFGLNDKNKQSMTYLYNRDGETFAILHQAYLKYKSDKNYVQAGRFEFSSPLIDSDDYFILSNSFEGVTSRVNIDNFDVEAGYIAKMSGSWDAGYDGGSFVSMSRSPWVHKADKNRIYSSDWPNPVTDFGIDDSGVAFIAFKYSDKDYKFQLWDYYALDFLNTIYTQLDVNLGYFNFAAQYNSFDEVGQMKDVTDPRAIIDYSVWGAKISTKINDITLNLGYTGVSSDESAHLWGSWGGFPYFACGMMVSYFETSLRDADMYAFNADMKITDKLATTLHAGYYDLNKEYTKDDLRLVPDGEGYMYTYGLSTSYKESKELSFLVKLAGRELESGNRSDLVRTILKYNF